MTIDFMKFMCPLIPAFKTCSCGAHYTREEWSELPLVAAAAPAGGPFVLEMRNCSCGSTMAVERLRVSK